jgi:WD40 repeat protein/serine/threonine protein kinase/tetratricopeptide (TPR) repeat protein
MSTPRSACELSIPTELIPLLEAACDRFEAALKAGERPSIEEYLEGMPGPGRAALLRHVVVLEREYRGVRGEHPAVEEYLPRFPDDGVAVRGAFEESGISFVGELTVDMPPIAGPPTEMKGRTIGPYRIVRELGIGGMGAVYEASQEQPVRRTVALKIIRPGMDTERVIARFEAERQALALMDHPNIARVLDAGATPDGRPYFVMELVRGVPITRFCEKQRLAYCERLELFVLVCQALQHAHQKGVIHRDIKPSNVLVATYDGRAVAKVIDFGLAKAIGQPLIENADHTGIGTILGTLPYMSPEQAGAAPDVDTRTDVYALGVLLYELLTGTTPLAPDRLKKAALAEVLRLIREEEPPRPSQRLAAAKDSLASISSSCRTGPARLINLVRGDLDWIVMKAIEKDRSHRYETASGLAADVLRYLAVQPVEARPPSRSYRVRKFVRRHRAGVVISGLILASLVALASVSTWFTLEIRHSLSLSNRRLAALYYERGQTAFDNEQIGIGLLMMAESWRWAAAGGDPVWQQAARANLSAWRRQLPRTRAVYLLPAKPIQRVAFSRDGGTVLMKTERGVRLEGRSPGATFLDADPFIEGSNPEQFVRPELHSPSPGRIITVDSGQDPSPLRRSAIVTSRPVARRVVRLWNAADGTAVGVRMFHPSVINCWTFGPDRKTLLTGTEDGTARLWDTTDGTPLGAPMAHPRSVLVVAFSPDGRAVATVCEDDLVRIWDAATGHPVGAPMAHPRRVLAVAFSPDGQTLLTGGADGAARWWDLGTRTQRVVPLFHSGPIHCVAFRTDGKAVLIGGGDGTVRLWELETRAYVEFSLGVATRGDKPLVALSRDGRTFFNGKWLRELATGRPVGPAEESASEVSAVALGPDGKTVFTAPSMGMNGKFQAYLFDATTGSRIGPPLVSQLPFSGAAFSPDGRILVTFSVPNTLRCYGAATGQPLGEPFVPDRGAVENVIFGPDPRYFVTTSTARGGQPDFLSLDGRSFTFNRGHLLRIWDTKTRKPIGDFPTGPGDRPGPGILALAFHPDGKVLLTGSGDGSASFWDAATAKPLGEPLPHPAAVRAVAFGPDGKRVLTGCDDGAARLWDAASGRLLGTPLAHRGPVLAVAFSLDGKTLLTGGEDSTVQAWDTMTLRPLGRPLLHPAPVVQLAFSPDGRTFRALIREVRPPWPPHYRLRIWNAAELPDDLPRVEDWVHLLTNLGIDARGTIKVLDQESVVKLRRRIGNPDSLDIARIGDELAPIPEAWADTDPAKSLLGRAQRLSSEGKYEDVVATLREAVRLTPQDPLAHTELARALRQLGRFDEALVECQEALRLKPNDGWAQQVHGWVLLGKEDWDGALAEYRKAKDNGRGNEASLYHQIGIAFLGKGQLDEAIAQFRTAVATNPFGREIFEPARDSLACALRDAGRMAELVDEFRAAMGRDRNDAMARIHYCRALLWAGRLEEAIAASREAARMMPDFGPAWQVLAYCLFSDRDWDGAISAYREALRRDPDNPAAHDELGIALRGRGRLDEALPEFERAIALAPRVPEYARELAATRRHQVLAPRLPAVLRGDDRPAEVSDRLDFAYICDNRKLHAAAARMFAEAFKADPTLVDDRERWHRYHAARNAALAARGKGEDQPGPDRAARLGLLAMALRWLEEERAAREARLPRDPAAERARVVRVLNHWKYDPDLAGLRDPAAIEGLPAGQRDASAAFWAALDRMLGRADGKAP